MRITEVVVRLSPDEAAALVRQSQRGVPPPADEGLVLQAVQRLMQALAGGQEERR